ncbi:hypothetical protein Tco_0636308 [Tanacetum coccineum]
MVAFLEKSIGSVGFHQIIDFLNRSHICYALTKKPAICVSFIKQFWRFAEVTTAENGEVKIAATIDGHSLTITEGSFKRNIQHSGLMGYHDSDKLTFQKGAFSPDGRIGVLEGDLKKTKQTYSSAFTKLILRVKKLEAQVKIGKAMRRAKIGEVPNMLVLLRIGELKISDFKGMSYDEIRPIFEKVWDFNQQFEPMDMEHGTEKMKSPKKIEEEDADTQEEVKEVSKETGAKRKKSIPRKSTRKRQKIEEDAEEEELKGFLDIIPLIKFKRYKS